MMHEKKLQVRQIYDRTGKRIGVFVLWVILQENGGYPG